MVTWYSEIVEIVTYFFRQASSRVVCPWQLVMNHLASSAGKFRRANLSWCGSHLVSLWFYIMREKVCVSPSLSGFLSPPWLSPLLFSCLHQNKQTAVQTAEWLVCQAHGMSYMTISERVTEANSICFKSDSSLVLKFVYSSSEDVGCLHVCCFCLFVESKSQRCSGLSGGHTICCSIQSH